MTNSDDRLFTSNYVLATAVQLFVSLVFMSLMTSMALFAARMFAVNDTAAGFAASAFVVGAAVSRLAFGKFFDVLGRRKTLIISLSIFIVCSGLYLLAVSYPLLIAVRLIHGMAFGAISTTITAVAISLIPMHRRSEGVGYFGLAATISNGVGPLIAVPMSLNLDPVWMFTYTGVLSVFALVAVLILRVPERRIPDEERRNLWRFQFSMMIDPDALPIGLVTLSCGLAYSSVMTYLTPFMVELGTAVAATLFFIVYSVAMLIIRLFAGRVQDRKGDNAVVPVLLVSFALGLGLLAVSQQLWAVIVAAVLIGFGFGGLVPGLQVIGINRARPDRVSIATSTHFLALDTGIALAPVLLGWMITLSGYPALYAISVVIVLGALALYWLVHGRFQQPSR